MEVAFNKLTSPHVIVDGAAVTFIGCDDEEFTDTVTDVLEVLEHETAFHLIII